MTTAEITVKSWIQTFLNRVGLYQRIKASRLYDLYWILMDRQLIERRREEVEFYRRTLKGLRKGDMIFDVGANQGYKTDIFLRLGAQVIAIEPDEQNQAVLEQRFSTYRLIKKPVVIVRSAVADRNGSQTMWIDEPGSAKNTLNPKWVETLRGDPRRFGKSLAFGGEKKIQTVTLEDLFVSHGRPFYIKIDVEGFEVSVLRGLQTSVPYISFEVNLPEFRSEAVECIELLEQVAANGQYSYSSDCSKGLALEGWLDKEDFLQVFDRCEDDCIEVYWKAPES